MKAGRDDWSQRGTQENGGRQGAVHRQTGKFLSWSGTPELSEYGSEASELSGSLSSIT